MDDIQKYLVCENILYIFVLVYHLNQTLYFFSYPLCTEE